MDDKQIDWEAIEPNWRAGIKTKLQMSKEFGVSRAAIDKHFNKLKISRDLSNKIRTEASALVTQDAVTRKVTPQDRVTEKEIIETNAAVLAEIIRSHRKDITRYRSLCENLLQEIDQQTGERVTFEELQEMLSSGDSAGMDRAFKKALSTSNRVDSVKKLADTLKILISLERQAFGLSDNNNGDADKYKQGSLPMDDKTLAAKIAGLFALAQARANNDQIKQ